MTDLEAQRRRLYGRMREARAAIDGAADPDERSRQRERLRILREMYRDICDQLDAQRPPQEKRHKAPRRQTVSTDALSFDFFERCGTVWSDIDGRSWSALEAAAEEGTARDASLILAALRSAMGALTDNQRECVMALYARGMTVEAIAAERGVQPSTVSRTVRRGLVRLERCILAALQARQCAGPDGFDFLQFAEKTDVLSERQREYLYLLLTDGATMADIAAYLGLDKSVISRGSGRIEANLAAVRPGLAGEKAARKVDRSEWAGRPEREVAERLGLSPAAYYRHVCRGQPVGGVSRLAYEVLRLGDIPAEEAARRLGLSAGTVRKYRRQYRGVDVSDLDTPEPYAPRQRRRETPDLRRLLSGSGGGTIGDRVDAATYRKMLTISKSGKR